MHVSELDYALPESLIAQSPAPEREDARLLCLDRKGGGVAHRRIRDLPRLLPPALLVVNDTRVIPARLRGHKPTGGRVELLLVERLDGDLERQRWLAWAKPFKGLGSGTRVALAAGLEAEVAALREGPALEVVLRVGSGDASVDEAIERVGVMPLPPYIRRDADASDARHYQTVFARRAGAIAAPTAGLHFTSALLDALEAAGHGLARVTLHVGPGTFAPLRSETLAGHTMHAERFEIPEETAEAIAQAKREGRAVLAVGTTVMRTLEASARATGRVVAGAGRTDLFIYPPFAFRTVDALLTNFHLPRSTLLALVMAFGGIEPVRRAYAVAVAERYRFFSYGDAMLVYDRP